MAYEFDKSGKDMSRGTHDKVIHKIENCKCKKVYQTEESLSFSIARQFEKIKIVDCETTEEMVTHVIEDDGNMEVIDTIRKWGYSYKFFFEDFFFHS